MYKNKYYMRKKYSKLQVVKASLSELLSLPGAHQYPAYKLALKVPPSVKFTPLITVDDFVWTNKRPKRKLLNYDKANWAKRFQKKELVHAAKMLTLLDKESLR